MPASRVTDYSVRCTDSYDRGGQAQNLQLVTLSNKTRKCTMFHSNLLNTTHVLANLYDLFKPHSQSRPVSEHADLKVKNCMWKSSISEFTVGKNIIYPILDPHFFLSNKWQVLLLDIYIYVQVSEQGYRICARQTPFVCKRDNAERIEL